jgi:hypothetical protein
LESDEEEDLVKFVERHEVAEVFEESETGLGGKDDETGSEFGDVSDFAESVVLELGLLVPDSEFESVFVTD